MGVGRRGPAQRDVDGPLAPERQQPHRPGADQPQRIEVGLRSLDPSPVQTRVGQAVRACRGQRADAATGRDGVAHRHGGVDRLVGRTGSAVIDHDDAATGQDPSPGDRAGQRGPHRLARRAGEVDAPMARAPGVGRRVEAGHDRRLRREGPDAHRIGRGACRRGRPEQRQDEGRQQEAAYGHADRLSRPAEPPSRGRRDLGISVSESCLCTIRVHPGRRTTLVEATRMG